MFPSQHSSLMTLITGILPRHEDREAGSDSIAELAEHPLIPRDEGP